MTVHLKRQSKRLQQAESALRYAEVQRERELEHGDGEEQQQRRHQAGDREGDTAQDEDARGLPVPRQEEGEDQAKYFLQDVSDRYEIPVYF